jgi:hypothetical protein
MNVGNLENKLLNAAKQNPPDDKVPYAFEKRIMANLKPSPVRNLWFSYGKSLWRGAFSCMAITVLCGIWSFSNLKKSETETLAQDFEGAVYATIDQHIEDSW